jgi:type IV pilus assembly protein PilW
MIRETGFTIIELLIAMAITGVVTAGIYTAYLSQQKSYITQDNVVEMQQNLRAAMDIMVREIRMAGCDPQSIGGLGITEIEPRNKNHVVKTDITGNGALKLTADFNDSGTLENSETISYSVYDSPVNSPDGNPDLARDNGAGRQVVAENIEALGFAFAFDSDGDGNLDTYDVAGYERVVWAVDSDGDNNLDTNLDTDGDGDIDADDGPGAGGNGLIGGQALAANVAPANIRAVRIWILARSRIGDRSFLNTRTYVIGNKVITPNTDADSNNDNCRMRLLTTTVKCRNMGLN